MQVSAGRVQYPLCHVAHCPPLDQVTSGPNDDGCQGVTPPSPLGKAAWNNRGDRIAGRL